MVVQADDGGGLRRAEGGRVRPGAGKWSGGGAVAHELVCAWAHSLIFEPVVRSYRRVSEGTGIDALTLVLHVTQTAGRGGGTSQTQRKGAVALGGT